MNPSKAVVNIIEAAWILTLEKRGSWDFMQKAMNKGKSESLTGFDIYGTKDLLMLEAKVAFENAKEEIKEHSVGLNMAAEIIYQWEAAVFRIFDESRKILSTDSVLEAKKDELYDLMMISSKQLKEYERYKAERDAFTKYRNSLESKSSLLHELGKLLTTESENWKGVSEWRTALEEVKKKQEILFSDSLFAASVLTYFGPFSYFSRKQLRAKLIQSFKELELPTQENPKISEILGDQKKLSEWHERNLLRDETSIENAFILESSKQWALIIDPEGAASKWIGQKNTIRDSNRYYKDDLIKAMTKESNVALHITTEQIDEDILTLVSLNKERTDIVQLTLPSEKAKIALLPESRKSDIKPIDVNPRFGFILYTEHSNPVFDDNLLNSMNIVNFRLSPLGLQDQFVIEYGIYLGENDYAKAVLNTEHILVWECIALEKRIVEEMGKIVLTSIDTEEQRLIKDNIQDLQENLEESRKKVKEATKEENKERADKVNAVLPLASRAAILYQCIGNLIRMNPTYLYTFKVIRNLFIDLVKNNYEQISQIQQQGLLKVKEFLIGLANTFTNSIMRLLEQSMFRSDYLNFALYLAANLSLHSNELKEDEWLLLLYGSEYLPVKDFNNGQENSLSSNIDSTTWNALGYLENIVGGIYKGLCESIASKANDWTLWLSEPLTSVLPIDIENNKLKPLQRLLLIRLMCSERVLEYKDWAVSSVLGNEYLKIKHPTIISVFKTQTKINQPLLIIKDEAGNPEAEVINQEDLHFISFNLTQENYALVKKTLDETKKTFDKSDIQWFYISNIDLFPDFGRYIVNKLKDLTISASDSAIGFDLNDKWFRLILVSKTCRLPRELLIDSTRLTIEAPSTMKQKVIEDLKGFRARENADAVEIKYNDRSTRLLFSLSLLHAAVDKRNVFGYKGWVNPLVITPGDIDLLGKLCLYLFDTPKDSPIAQSVGGQGQIEISWTGIQDLVTKIWLGGQITEDYDTRALSCFVSDYLNEEASIGNYAPEGKEASKFHVPEYKTLKELITYASELPETDDPRLCDMTSDAILEQQHNELTATLKNIEEIENRKNEVMIKEQVEESDIVVMKIIEEMPEHELLKEDIHPIILETKKGLLKGLHVYILQEMQRYNSLIKHIQHIVTLIKEHCKKNSLMPATLEKVYMELAAGYVPEEFTGYSWKHPIGEWIITLKMRIEYVRDWLKAGETKGYWLRALINPKGLFNALLVHSAQLYKQGIESLSLVTQITPYKNMGDIVNPDPRASYIYGLYMINAKINEDTNTLDELTAEDEKKCGKDFKYAKMPIVSVIVTSEQKEITENFECPLYYLPKRITKLGSLKNYLRNIECLTSQPMEHWIKKQVLMTCIDPESNS